MYVGASRVDRPFRGFVLAMCLALVGSAGIPTFVDALTLSKSGSVTLRSRFGRCMVSVREKIHAIIGG